MSVSDTSARDLVDALIEVLASYDLRPVPTEPGDGGDLVVEAPTSDGPRHLRVDVRSSVPRERRAGAADLLGVDHVPAVVADRYRADDQFFVDASGNAYIRLPGFVLDVRGRARATPRPPITGRAFTRAGARVLFTLLVRPELSGATVRRLAALAGTSVGTASHVLDDLRREGHLSLDGDLLHVPHLAELWLATYRTTLSRSLESARTGGPAPTWWLDQEPVADAALSGGVALAARGTGLTPDSAVVYGTPPWSEIRRAARLNRSDPPTVELRERFWSADLTDEPHLAPSLLVYADAAASPDARVSAAAAQMWEDDVDLRRYRAGR